MSKAISRLLIGCSIGVLIIVSVVIYRSYDSRQRAIDQYLKIANENVHVGESIERVKLTLSQLKWDYVYSQPSNIINEKTLIASPSSYTNYNIEVYFTFHSGILTSITGAIEDPEV